MAVTKKKTETTYLTPAQLVAKAEKDFGPGIIVLGKSLKGRKLVRVTSGSLAFDYMLGGGWPVNQWNEIIGEPSHGKTALVMKTLADNQAIDPDYTALWIASEHFVPEYAESYGVDLDRVHVVETNVMEDAFAIILEWLDNRACDCIVIDSYPALVPSSEDEASIDAFQVGLGARLNGKFFRKSNKSQRRSLIDEDRDCLLLIINQWRDKIGVMYGDPRTTPGGKAKDYAYFTRVVVRRNEWIESDKERVGIEMIARTIKNKTAPVERTASLRLYFADADGFKAGEIDTASDVFNTATFLGLIKRGTPRYSYRGRGWGQKADLIYSLQTEPELVASMRADVLSFSGPIPDDDDEPAPKKKLARK